MDTAAQYFEHAHDAPEPVQVAVFNGQVRLYHLQERKVLLEFPLRGTGVKQDQWGVRFYPPGRSSYLFLPADHFLARSMVREVEDAAMGTGRRIVRRRLPMTLGVIALILVGSYLLLVSLVPWLGQRLISVEQEIRIGEQMREVLRQQETAQGRETNKQGTAYLQQFADLLDLSNRYPIRVSLVSSPEINAYALPGGQLVVYTGILEKIKTPEALAALLAHEATHVNERHTLRSLLRRMANRLAIATLFGDAGSVGGALLDNADALYGLRFSRSLEAEADEKGMELLLANRVPVRGMEQLMETLQEAGDMPGELSFLSTHPLTSERRRGAVAFARSHPQSELQRPELKELFHRLKPWAGIRKAIAESFPAPIVLFQSLNTKINLSSFSPRN